MLPNAPIAKQDEIFFGGKIRCQGLGKKLSAYATPETNPFLPLLKNLFSHEICTYREAG